MSKRLEGRIVHARKLSKNVFFVDLRLSPIFKNRIFFYAENIYPPPHTRHSFGNLWRRVKLGDIISTEVFPVPDNEQEGKDYEIYQSRDFTIKEEYPLRGGPFVPEPALGTENKLITEDVSNMVCKFWINTKRCVRDDCLFQHPQGDEWTKKREQWIQTRLDTRRIKTYNPSDPHSTKLPHEQRALAFCHWIVRTYGIEYLNLGSGVIDIAGGRGQISSFLSHVFGVKCTLVEPNLRKNSKWRRRKMDKLIRQLTSTEEANRDKDIEVKNTTYDDNDIVIEDKDDKGDDNEDYEDTMTFLPSSSSSTLRASNSKYPITHIPAALNPQFVQNYASIIQNASLFIGLHPDQATEPIVDTALHNTNSRAFAVVPCCTFAHENPDRKLKDGREVVTTEEFIEYLLEKDEKCEKDWLEIVGANVIVFRRPDIRIYDNNNNKS